MVTRTEKAYKNPRSTMADGRLTGQARNISAPMRQGGVMQAAAEARRHRGAPPVPYTRPPVSTRQRAETALTRGVERAGPDAIAKAATTRLRGVGQRPGAFQTPTPGVPRVYEQGFEPEYDIFSDAGKRAVEEANPEPESKYGTKTGADIGEEGLTSVMPNGEPGIPIYSDITGELIGFYNEAGTTFDADGNQISATGGPISTDPWDPDAGKYESEKPPTTQELIDMYLADDSEAVSVQDVLGQHYGLSQAEAQSGTQLASMMGGLGMGRAGQHMQAQTALSAETLKDKAGINLKAAMANANFNAEKAKNIIQIHGEGLNREERSELFDELMARQKDVDKFAVAEYLLGLSGNDQFDLAGLGKFFEMYDQGASLDEVLEAMVAGGHMTAKAAKDNRGILEKIYDSTVGKLLGSNLNPLNWL